MIRAIGGRIKGSPRTCAKEPSLIGQASQTYVNKDQCTPAQIPSPARGAFKGIHATQCLLQSVIPLLKAFTACRISYSINFPAPCWHESAACDTSRKLTGGGSHSVSHARKNASVIRAFTCTSCHHMLGHKDAMSAGKFCLHHGASMAAQRSASTSGTALAPPIVTAPRSNIVGALCCGAARFMDRFFGSKSCCKRRTSSYRVLICRSSRDSASNQKSVACSTVGALAQAAPPDCNGRADASSMHSACELVGSSLSDRQPRQSGS
jgi:hypothetical protein